MYICMPRISTFGMPFKRSSSLRSEPPLRHSHDTLPVAMEEPRYRFCTVTQGPIQNVHRMVEEARLDVGSFACSWCALRLTRFVGCSLKQYFSRVLVYTGKKIMSAYAFPGFLLPPIPTSIGIHDGVASSTNAFSSNSPPGGPLHHQNETSFTGLLRASVDLLSVPSFTTTGETRAVGDVASSKTSCSDDTRSEEPGIAVKEAKIDPVRFIQRITGTGTRGHVQPRKTLRRRGSRERLGGVEPISQQSFPFGSKQTYALGDEDRQQPPTVGKGSPHDDAIAFELSISFNGRKYTATRTLQCIVELRDDLIQEMKSRRQWLSIRPAISNTFTTSPSPSIEEAGVSTASTCTSTEDVAIEIPEIPPLVGEESMGGSGFVGRGFTMLHAMATSYVPVMERWLRSVMAIVPQDSVCLTNFLWEPIANEAFPLELPSKSCNSLAALGSIKELDYKTDESDDEEIDHW